MSKSKKVKRTAAVRRISYSIQGALKPKGKLYYESFIAHDLNLLQARDLKRVFKGRWMKGSPTIIEATTIEREIK